MIAPPPSGSAACDSTGVKGDSGAGGGAVSRLPERGGTLTVPSAANSPVNPTPAGLGLVTSSAGVDLEVGQWS